MKRIRKIFIIYLVTLFVSFYDAVSAYRNGMVGVCTEKKWSQNKQYGKGLIGIKGRQKIYIRINAFLYINYFMGQKIDKDKLNKIKEKAAEMGSQVYKYVQPFIINLNQLIGQGSYGSVFKGADMRNGNLIAVKTIATSNIKKDPQKFFQALRNQIQIMKKLKHQNIVALYDVKKSPNNIYLFQELCDKGTLEGVLRTRHKLPEAQVVMVTQQIVAGYKCLHDHKIIHRDLKPANILIKDEVYKIADFGFAKTYESGSEELTIHQSIVGSPIYMCPQILNRNLYSTKSDVWSTGIMIYQMLFGTTPHKAESLEELISKVNKKTIAYPQKIKNKKLQDLLTKMLLFDAEERISWKEIFQHELFKENQSQGVMDSMNLAEKTSINKLQLSTKTNEIYFEDKKIIEEIRIREQGQDTMEEEVSTLVHPKSQEKDAYKIIASKHQKIEVKKAIVSRIKNWFIFKRNKAVFLNHIALKIHSCFELNVLEMDLIKAEMFILVLSKWQCMITYKSYTRLKEGKVNSKDFSEDEYQLFMRTPLRDKLLQKFKNDFTVMKMFFDELLKKVDKFLKSFNKIPQDLIHIKQVCHQGVVQKEILNEIYSLQIDKMNKVCLVSLEKHPKCRQLIQLCFLINEALKLKKGELKTTEFSMIYDQEEKLSNTQLIGKIKGTYEESSMFD